VLSLAIEFSISRSSVTIAHSQTVAATGLGFPILAFAAPVRYLFAQFVALQATLLAAQEMRHKK
jgi:hypothetical protein